MDKISKIKAILLDVDGTLTDESIIYDINGKELKKFNVKDGLAISEAGKLGIKIFFITARKSDAVIKRGKEIGITKVYHGIADKKIILKKIVKNENILKTEIAYVGDDLPDISIMSEVGMPIAVANARPEVKKIAKFITKLDGGKGAVREAIEHILKQQDQWTKIIEKYI